MMQIKQKQSQFYFRSTTSALL